MMFGYHAGTKLQALRCNYNIIVCISQSALCKNCKV